MTRRIITFAAVVIAATAAAPRGAGAGRHPLGQTAPDNPATRAQSVAVDALLAPWDQRDGPGAAVIVVRDGQVLHSKGYGLANRQTRAPFRPDTASLIGSMAKPFTAMAIMMLAEQGALGYDDPLSRFFPDVPPHGRRITIRNLLNHTAGVPSFEDFLARQRTLDRLTAAEVLASYLQQPPRFAPGERWEYENGGYVVLSHVVATASGSTYVDFMRKRIFEALGMRNTFFAEEPRLATARRATGYYREWHGLKVSETLPPLKFYNGQASLFSTTEDLYLWDQALYPDRLVKTTTLQEAFTGGRLVDGTPLLYGFGWEVFHYKGVRYMIHPGGWAGFKSFMLRFPDQRFTVIALSNSNRFDLDTLPMGIARIYLGGHIEIPPKVGKGGTLASHRAAGPTHHKAADPDSGF